MSELERWEARFAAPGYHFGTQPNAFLKSKAGLLKPGSWFQNDRRVTFGVRFKY